MKTLILLLISASCFSQTYFHLNGGVVESSKHPSMAAMTWSVGFDHKIDDWGVRASFYNTNGIRHSFDSYTLGVSRKMHEDKYYKLFAHLGGVYDRNTWYGEKDLGMMIGLNNWFKIDNNAYVTLDFDLSGYGSIRRIYTIPRLMVGVVLKVKLTKKKGRRFF